MATTRIRYRNVYANRELGPVLPVFYDRKPTKAQLDDFRAHVVEFDSVPGREVVDCVFVD